MTSRQTIAEKAKDNGVSQNQYINYLLTKALDQDLHNQTQFNTESLVKEIVKEHTWQIGLPQRKMKVF